MRGLVRVHRLSSNDLLGDIFSTRKHDAAASCLGHGYLSIEILRGGRI